MDFLVLAESWVLQVLNRQDELFLRKMGPIQYSVFLRFEILWIGFSHLLASVNKVADWVDDVILNILYQSVDKWASNVFDPALDPNIIVQEVSFSC